LERLSGWLDQAIEESRSAPNSLRSSTTLRKDLADALQSAGEGCMSQGSLEFHLSVAGASRELHPIVRDEVYRIGYEAIRNARLHSGASRLNVQLSYAAGLTLRVRDNGGGIDPAIAAKGKEGHFGLIGMYERASRVRGKLTLSSSPGAGTEVELIVPAMIAFQRQRGVLEKIRSFFPAKERGRYR
jgi:signal transduction histidine kinase